MIVDNGVEKASLVGLFEGLVLSGALLSILSFGIDNASEWACELFCGCRCMAQLNCFNKAAERMP
jgi:hypothetical protein